jgi:hypothetical protein
VTGPGDNSSACFSRGTPLRASDLGLDLGGRIKRSSRPLFRLRSTFSGTATVRCLPVFILPARSLPLFLSGRGIEACRLPLRLFKIKTRMQLFWTATGRDGRIEVILCVLVKLWGNKQQEQN